MTESMRSELDGIKRNQRENRYNKAARLVHDGLIVETPAKVFVVDGSEGQRYLVTIRTSDWSKTGGVPAYRTCNCAFGRQQAESPDPEPCSHILAACALVAASEPPVSIFKRLKGDAL